MFVAPILGWGTDLYLGYVYPERKTGGFLLCVCRTLSFAPLLPILGLLLFWGPLFLPSFAEHNSEAGNRIVLGFLGPDVPIDETWYARGKVFTGSGATFIRLRFREDSRAAVTKAMHANCTKSDPGNGSGLGDNGGFEPEAWFMRWDPPDNPIDPHNCNGYGADFGSDGDSLFFFEPGP